MRPWGVVDGVGGQVAAQPADEQTFSPPGRCPARALEHLLCRRLPSRCPSPRALRPPPAPRPSPTLTRPSSSSGSRASEEAAARHGCSKRQRLRMLAGKPHGIFLRRTSTNMFASSRFSPWLLLLLLVRWNSYGSRRCYSSTLLVHVTRPARPRRGGGKKIRNKNRSSSVSACGVGPPWTEGQPGR